MHWRPCSRGSDHIRPSDDQSSEESYCCSRCCPIESSSGKSDKLSDWNLKKIRIQENALKQKEKEILRRHDKLNKKYRELMKNEKERENKALKAEAKLKEAKKKLMLVINATNKIQKHNKKKWKCKCETKSCKEQKRQKKSVVDINKSIFNTVWDKIHMMFCLPPDNRCDPCSRMDPSSRMGTRFMPFCRPSMFQSQGCRSRLGMPFSSCRCNSLDRQCGDAGASGDCYLMSLRRTPHLWMYQRWPCMYPHFLDFKTFCKQLQFCLMLALAFIFWTPILICLYLCKCCYCACCTDCYC